MPEAIVTGVDRYNYMGTLEGPIPTYYSDTAVKGETITVSDEEFERGKALGALSSPAEEEARQAADAYEASASAGVPWEEDPEVYGLRAASGTSGLYLDPNAADQGQPTIVAPSALGGSYGTGTQQAATWTDEQLEGANAEELVAYAGQHPEEHERVLAAEQGRSSPRVTVLRALGAEE